MKEVSKVKLIVEQDIVDELEKLLAVAKTGEIKDFSFAYVDVKGYSVFGRISYNNRITLVGAITRLLHHTNLSLDQTSEILR